MMDKAMTESAITNLDHEELLHLAILASRENRHEEAIRHLKAALEIAGDNARIHYFLGAEHAQIGMHERAILDMSKAVALDPTLHTAHFQLGLLHLTFGRTNEAYGAWQSLDALEKEHPLFLFKTGLLALAADDFPACKLNLEKGIAKNSLSEALNQDMRQILQKIDDGKEGGSAEGRDNSQHVFLNAYTDKAN